ncbi:hypothetical protein [Mycobacterium leprae]|uniref:hypothetical protein n=1 Tax=Mycobacterium leprae TaxID=1769 RepID=UPI0002E0983A|nr:hypothetical protein [Mycobacterium leprae]
MSSVAKLARSYTLPEREVRTATVKGTVSTVIYVAGQATTIMGFITRDGRITAIEVLADPHQINKLNL